MWDSHSETEAHCMTGCITTNVDVQSKDMTKRLIGPLRDLRCARTFAQQRFKQCTSANSSLRSDFASFASAEVLRGLNLFFPACAPRVSASRRGAFLAAAQPSEWCWRRMLNLHGEKKKKKSRAGQCVSGDEGTRGRALGARRRRRAASCPAATQV